MLEVLRRAPSAPARQPTVTLKNIRRRQDARLERGGRGGQSQLTISRTTVQAAALTRETDACNLVRPGDGR